MANNENIKALTLLALRNKYVSDILLGIAGDFACLIEHTLERCSHNECSAAATVRHVDLGVCMCDYHAAKTMVHARQNLLNEPSEELAPLRVRLADEKCWRDLPDATRIRRIVEYVEELRKSDEESEPAIDISEYH